MARLHEAALMPWVAIGALLNSALYLMGIVAAGLVWNDPLAVKCALSALGVTFLSYARQFDDIGAERGRNTTTVVISGVTIALGIWAGLFLLIGV